MIISADAFDYSIEAREEWARMEGIEEGMQKGMGAGVDMTLEYLISQGILTGEKAEEARKAISPKSE